MTLIDMRKLCPQKSQPTSYALQKPSARLTSLNSKSERKANFICLKVRNLHEIKFNNMYQPICKQLSVLTVLDKRSGVNMKSFLWI